MEGAAGAEVTAAFYVAREAPYGRGRWITLPCGASFEFIVNAAQGRPNSAWRIRAAPFSEAMTTVTASL